MKTTKKQVREVLNTKKYWLEAQFCHPENVPSEALELAEDSADEALMSVTDDEIEEVIEEDEDLTVAQVIQTVANNHAQTSGYSTITVCVFLK